MTHRFSLVILLIFGFTNASFGAAGITYFGRLLRADGTPVTEALVKFHLQVRTPGNENCLMFEETHLRNLSQANGVFALTINDGTAASVNTEPFTLDRVFQNRGTFTFAAGKCGIGTTYTPNPADGRKLVVEFDDGTMGGTWESLPAQAINYVPMSLETMAVGGYNADSLLRVHDGSGNPATIPALSNTQYSSLTNLLAGSGSVATFTGSLGGDVTGTQGATSVVKLRGRDISTTAPTDGQVLTWNNTTSKWEATTVSAGVGPQGPTGPQGPPGAQGPTGPQGPAGPGSVTSVAMSVPSIFSLAGSPITASGTLAVSLASQSANTVFAGPTSGSGVPTFRSLNIADIRSTNTGSFLSGTTCSAGQALVYSSVSDTISCSSISLTSSQVTTALTYTPVNKAGDTMSGALALPSNGLAVGANQLVVSGASVGIGTATPSQKLEVAGNIKVSGTGNGITFPDGTTQTTAGSASLPTCPAGDYLISTGSGWGCSSSAYKKSCKEILAAGQSTGDGFYTIKPTTLFTAVQVYCDMTTNGGGWTLVGNISSSNSNHFRASAYDSNGNGTVDHSYLGEKFSDATIDSIYTDRIWVQTTGSGDIHCAKANQSGAGLTFAFDYAPICGYTYASPTGYGPYAASGGPSVWVNYDYRSFNNPYGCGGAAAAYSGGGNGGCGYIPGVNGYLWIR